MTVPPTIPPTMRALRQASSHGPRDLEPVRDVPVPRPGLTATAAGISRVVEFRDPALVAMSGLPEVLPG
ncbi:hypothetical protein ACFPK1_01390 [Actinomycetospora rhizophila]|uniref:FXSXX-COOH protein n=1 Tax=Actinomycetospora rhizophila TaxID=1416876 RepID=A0ABV9Z5S5_9PSEU